jgi:hypothetical protein
MGSSSMLISAEFVAGELAGVGFCAVDEVLMLLFLCSSSPLIDFRTFTSLVEKTLLCLSPFFAHDLLLRSLINHSHSLICSPYRIVHCYRLFV